MANGFNTEVLRRSVGRNPRTLLEFADLPQVQPGPSQGAIIADIAGQTIKGIGQQILQSKKLDLDAQRTAAQIGMAQDTHNLNVRKQDYEENTSTDNRIIDSIQKSGFASAPDTIAQFSDTVQGNKLRGIYEGAYNDIKPAYEAKESFEEFAEKRSISDIIMEEGGKERLDSYMSLNLDDARFNIKRDQRIIGLVDEYNKNRGYYDLVSNKEEFQKIFGLDQEPGAGDADYSLFRGLNAKQGQDLLVLKLKQKNPGIDPLQFEQNFKVVSSLSREIQTNEQSIRNFQNRADSKVTLPAEVKLLKARIENLTSVNAEKRRQINILTKEYQPAGAPKTILDQAVHSTKQETVDGKTFNVGYNKAGEEIKRTISEAADPFEVKEAETKKRTKAIKKRMEKIPNVKFTNQDLMDVFVNPEDRQKLEDKFNELTEKGKGLDKQGVVSAYSPEWKIFLDDMGFFGKLRELRNLRQRQQEGAVRADTMKSRLAQSPDALPVDTSAYEF